MRIVAGRHRGRPIRMPPSAGIRPTSDRARQSLFDVLEHGIDWPGFAGTRVLDVFAGSGACGLEALSRGALHAIFLDSDKGALLGIRRNAAELGEAHSVTLLALDASRLPPPPVAAQPPSDLAFLDPPYDSGLATSALQGLAARGWIEPAALCTVEVAAREPLLLPTGFSTLDERVCGSARLVVLRAPG